MKNIMCTGFCGFVGSAVHKKLLAMEGINVFGFDLPNNDFTNAVDIETFIEGNNIDTIIHIGAVAGLDFCMDNPSDAIKANVYGTGLLLEAAKKHSCKFIHTSTWAVNGKLEHPYDITKNMAEELVQMYNKVYGLETMILRLATMYGPGMRPNGVIWAFLEKSMKGEDITIQGDGNQFRQFLWVEDAAEAFKQSLTHFESGRICEVQASNRVSVRQLAEAVYPDNKDKIKYLPKRKGDEESFYVDPEETEKALGWKAKIDIKEGMKKLKEFMKQ